MNGKYSVTSISDLDVDFNDDYASKVCFGFVCTYFKPGFDPGLPGGCHLVGLTVRSVSPRAMNTLMSGLLKCPPITGKSSGLTKVAYPRARSYPVSQLSIAFFTHLVKATTKFLMRL
jgi:hypothetical protein